MSIEIGLKDIRTALDRFLKQKKGDFGLKKLFLAYNIAILLI